MPAKRKTTADTQAALQRLFDARAEWERNEREIWPPLGMERTPGYTTHRRLPSRLGTTGGEYRNHEPIVWVFRKRMRIDGTLQMQDTDPLVTALWETLPESERRRSRLFGCCADCPVRFTKRGAIADALRHGRPPRRYGPPTAKERVAAELRGSTEPPELEPQDEHERAVAEVWNELAPAHRRTLYAVYRPTMSKAIERRGVPLISWFEPDREWALEGAPSPEAFISRMRTARRALARALASRFLPDVDYSVKTRGRRGFDYERFWKDWDAYLGVG